MSAECVRECRSVSERSVQQCWQCFEEGELQAKSTVVSQMETSHQDLLLEVTSLFVSSVDIAKCLCSTHATILTVVALTVVVIVIATRTLLSRWTRTFRSRLFRGQASAYPPGTLPVTALPEVVSQGRQTVFAFLFFFFFRWCLMSLVVGSHMIWGTSWDQCVSMVQYSFTSTETIRLIRTDSPGRPPRLSHSSWTMSFCFVLRSELESPRSRVRGSRQVLTHRACSCTLAVTALPLPELVSQGQQTVFV